MTIILQTTNIVMDGPGDAFGSVDSFGTPAVSIASGDRVIVASNVSIAVRDSVIHAVNQEFIDFTLLGDVYSNNSAITLSYTIASTVGFDFSHRVAIGAEASVTSLSSLGFIGVFAISPPYFDPTSSADFNNAGLMTSTSSSGIFIQAVGTANFVNSGTISVQQEEAVGFRYVNDASVINTGTMTSTETETSSINDGLISINTDVQNVYVINSGTMISLGLAYASDAETSEYLSNSGNITGDILMSDEVGMTSELVNSGLIEGDIDTQEGDDVIVNTGDILGNIEMGLNNDTLENAGLITGDVDLGTGGDTYLGISGGTVAGTISGGSGNDTITGATQADRIDGGSNDDLIRGRAGDDTVDGGTGNDTIRAGSGDDEIDGGNGDDLIRGGDGEDIIAGGQGLDILFGGQGADTFVYLTESDSPDDNALRDIIQDFNAGDDIIDLTAFAGLTYVDTGNLSGTGAEFTVSDPNSIGRVKIFIDTDGDGTADMKIILNNVTTALTEDDFLF